MSPRSGDRTILRTRRGVACAAVGGAALALACGGARAADAPAELSLEDLLKTEVSSVSRKTQRQFDAAAAVYVLTADDLQRSGATSLPDALRQVPGLDVAQQSAGRWSESARGFLGRFSNKLLVLLDGRSIYSPLYGGVLWEEQDIPLEDIERIEVVRGSGAAVWGSNAVNGVINIITRKARSTQGGQAAVSAGTRGDANGSVRYGGAVDDATEYRVWVSQAEHKLTAKDSLADDGTVARHGGFRLDRSLSGGARLSVSGEVHDVWSGELWYRPDTTQRPVAIATPPFFSQPAYTASVQGVDNFKGGSLQGDYQETFGRSEVEVLAYYEHSAVLSPYLIQDNRDTVDVEGQVRRVSGAHDVIAGASVRVSRDDLDPRWDQAVVDPEKATRHMVSAFVHDEWTLVPDRLRVTGGVRLEDTGGDRTSAQPNVRFAYTPDRDRTVWGAVAHAERAPARAEEAISFPLEVIPAGSGPNTGPLPLLVAFHSPSDGRLANESMDSTELGYRTRPRSDLSLDVAVFATRYRDLRAGPSTMQDCLFFTGFGPCANASLANPPLLVRTSSTTANTGDARTHGVELAADWHPVEWWRVQFAYSYLRLHTWEPASASPLADESASPRHNVVLRSSIDLARHVQLDGRLRYVSDLPASGVPGYTELDLRLAWRVRRDIELSVIGQNLLHPRHLESVGDDLPGVPFEMPRTLFAKARLNF
jgi:iron complex outermembrane recepter protein